MRFQLNLTLTEEDYLDFNYFHSLESVTAKKQLRKNRILLLCIVAALAVLVVLTEGWTVYSIAYIIFIGLFTVFYALLFKKITKRIMKKQVKNLKKTGKLPFDAEFSLEFYEDKFSDITDGTRLEQSYSTLERICVVGDRFICLYTNSIGGHILPIPQLREQLNQGDFLTFLSQKCSTVEYYQQ